MCNRWISKKVISIASIDKARLDSIEVVSLLSSMDPDMPRSWHHKDDERIVGEVAQGKEVQRKMGEVLREKINEFVSSIAATCQSGFKDMKRLGEEELVQGWDS